MRRVTTTAFAAIFLFGCQSGPAGEPVELVTAPTGPCFAYSWDVVLVGDPAGGLAAQYTQGELAGQTAPVIWPLGYVGRRDGAAVVVYDGAGKERARTGITAHLMLNDPIDATGPVHATCLNVSMEPPGASRGDPQVVEHGRLRA